MKETFGQILRNLRREKNISQRELAASIGVDFSYISKVENDRLAPPAAETILKIANKLGVASEILLFSSGKLSENIKDIVTSSPEVIRFLNEAREMHLKDEEWQVLFQELKKLR
jgi:transcriptional regulator with XRE-family HTH domain